MSEQSVVFKFVKSVYIVVLVVGLIGSALLLVIGLCAIRGESKDNVFYENVMKYYGIDELNFEPVLNQTASVRMVDETEYQNNYGILMVFVSLVSLIFESIALLAAIRDHLVISLTVLSIMIVSTLSGVFTVQTIDLCTIATQSIFILLSSTYVVLLKKQLTTKCDQSDGSSQTCKAV